MNNNIIIEKIETHYSKIIQLINVAGYSDYYSERTDESTTGSEEASNTRTTEPRIFSSEAAIGVLNVFYIIII